MLNVKKTLTKILTNLKSPIKVSYYTLQSHTYPANASWWLYSEDLHAVTISGYTPIATLQGTPGAQGALVPHVIIDYPTYGDRFAGGVRNTSSASITDAVAIPVLYIRNDLY